MRRNNTHQVLANQLFSSEEDLTRMLARQYRVPAVDLNRVQLDQKIIRLIPSDLAIKHLVLPLRRVGRTLTVAMANPADTRAIEDLRFVTRFDIEPVIVGEYTLRKHIERYSASDERLNESSTRSEDEVGSSTRIGGSGVAARAQIDDAPSSSSSTASSPTQSCAARRTSISSRTSTRSASAIASTAHCARS